jgi:hypothetical protein
MLLDKELNPGQYSLVYNARGVASDVYFFRLSALGYIETKKMLISK